MNYEKIFIVDELIWYNFYFKDSNHYFVIENNKTFLMG